jgi:glycosyltransferase involved in cell wall biosynthesis
MGVETFYAPEFAASWFEDWIAENGTELFAVVLSRPDVAAVHLPAIRQFPRLRIVYYGHDLHHQRLELQAEATNDDATRRLAEQTRAVEIDIWRQSDSILYLSSEEAEAVRGVMPGAPVSAVNGYAFDRFDDAVAGPEGRTDVLFVAGFAHPPNVDAAEWMVKEIMPRVWRERPAVRLVLAGSDPTRKVLSFASAQVEVTGWITEEALAQQYRQRRVAAVPLRFGAGVKSKVVEAYRHGLPLVTTPIGIQGLDGATNFTAVAETAEAFAAAVLTLLDDDEAWRRASAGQLSFARRTFSRATLAHQVRAVIDALDHRTAVGRRDPHGS